MGLSNQLSFFFLGGVSEIGTAFMIDRIYRNQKIDLKERGKTGNMK